MSTIEHILCPTDFSVHSAAALVYALRLAEGLGARVTLLHVCPVPLYVMPGGEYAPMGDDTATFMKSAQHELDKWVEKHSKDTPRALDSLLVHGDAYRKITAAAASLHVGLIVMGTHGRSGFSRLVTGSVAERVLRTSSCPVLTIPLAMAKTMAKTLGSEKPSAPV
ncbi:MAG: nucleotide-binding universal stress UspA family protein [Polyangiales bacterium]|jgi:nucleotide-binding universal stress UspA family protein